MDRQSRSKYNKEQQTYFIKLFTDAMDRKKQVLINNSLIIIVNRIAISESGCHQCKINYDSINLAGLLFDTDIAKWYKYYASISSFYIMCECYDFHVSIPGGGLNELPMLLFKGNIEREHNYILNNFINQDSVVILENS